MVREKDGELTALRAQASSTTQQLRADFEAELATVREQAQRTAASLEQRLLSERETMRSHEDKHVQKLEAQIHELETRCRELTEAKYTLEVGGWGGWGGCCFSVVAEAVLFFWSGRARPMRCRSSCPRPWAMCRS